jgi:hypothetical protein
MFPQNRTKENVSKLKLYLRCSRQIYFVNHGYELLPDITCSYIENLLIKELGFKYPEIIKHTSKDDGFDKILETEFNNTAENLEDIYPDELINVSSELVETAKNNVYKHLETIATNLNSTISYHGKNLLLEQITPCELPLS